MNFSIFDLYQGYYEQPKAPPRRLRGKAENKQSSPGRTQAEDMEATPLLRSREKQDEALQSETPADLAPTDSSESPWSYSVGTVPNLRRKPKARLFVETHSYMENKRYWDWLNTRYSTPTLTKSLVSRKNSVGQLQSETKAPLRNNLARFKEELARPKIHQVPLHLSSFPSESTLPINNNAVQRARSRLSLLHKPTEPGEQAVNFSKSVPKLPKRRLRFNFAWKGQ